MSWLRHDIDEERTWTQCCSGALERAGRSVQTWWGETTDAVILNSPWLRRTTGAAFRCGFLCLLTFMWYCTGLTPSGTDPLGMKYLYGAHDVPITLGWLIFMLLLIASFASFWAAVTRHKESIRATLAYVLIVVLMESFAVREPYFTAEIRTLYFVAVLCHCNVHPLPLLLAILFRLNAFAIHAWSDTQFSPFPQIRCAVFFSSLVFIFCAFTQDFTIRVKAVCSGMISRESQAASESPLSGRSARGFCWLMAVNHWLAWGITMLAREKHGAMAYPSLFKSHLPIWNWPGLCLLLAVLMILLCLGRYGSVWQADLALFLCCCTPPLLMLADLHLLPEMCSMPMPICFDFLDFFVAFATCLLFLSVQTLAQAGCHPACCIGPPVILSSVEVLFLLDRFYRFRHLYYSDEVGLAVPLSWLVWLSHTVDYFNRMDAIQTGMERMRQNAESNQCVLHNFSGVELQTLPEAGWFASYDLGVAVVTAGRGQDLAVELQQLAADMIISSPAPRCLQTAEILAEQLGAQVLLDLGLGEAQLVPAFHGRGPASQPPWDETLRDARERYAMCFLRYLKLARQDKKSRILVTHQHMLQVCAAMLPATDHVQVASMEEPAALMAICHEKEKVGTTAKLRSHRRVSSFDSSNLERPWILEDREDRLWQLNRLIQEARVAHWSVWLQGCRNTSTANSSYSITRKFVLHHRRLGISWQDVACLLSSLPELSTPEFAEDVASDSLSSSHDGSSCSSVVYFKDPTLMRLSPPSEASTTPSR